MSPLYLYNGALLTVDGALAVNENCCCDNENCSAVDVGNGWYTEQGLTDIIALYTSAGYTNINAQPTAPFEGAPIPYTDGCGQTFFNITAECCGTTVGCEPTFTAGNVNGIAGPGNQFPPCGEPEVEESFVFTCCNEFP